jgi:N4-gp56 family major capsid protein
MTALNDLNANTVTELANWIPEVWSKLVYVEAISKMLWNKYIGEEGSGMPVILKRDVYNGPGDTIRISQLANLTGAGVSGEATLQGNEEQLTLREVTTSPDWYRHAVAETKKAKVQITHDFREKARLVLGRWMAAKMDDSMWTAAQITAASGFTSAAVTSIYGNNATSVDSIDSTDTFGVEEIRKAVTKLQSNNIDKVGGEDGYYIILIHTFQKHNLIKDSEWLSAQREAGPRDPTNPIFSNILGHLGGAVIATTNACPVLTNANSPTVNYARAIAMGAEALCRGLGEDIDWAEEITDYGMKRGIGIGAAWEDKIMNSLALVHIVTAAVDPTA